ncbi:hypothetical protein KKE48_03125 [Patescibacteria group bacterium]|nr:hypothetical protein [Patescibacteria group bacterium]MBU1499834.1 hypothetical protein [Patescibacteria group bacterium]
MTQEYVQHLTEEYGIRLNENLGQHLLVDQEALGFIAGQLIKGANVVEIGSGPGNLTANLAQRANKVIGIEIDRRFEKVLADVTTDNKNVEILFSDALKLNFDKLISKDCSREWQIVGNIPYHISEPFLTKIVGLPVEDIILTVGDNLGYLIQLDNPYNDSFSRLSFLAQTFFDTQMLKTLGKSCFYPQPRTGSEVIRLAPKTKAEYVNPKLKIQKQLFLSESRSPTVGKVLTETMDLAIEQGKVVRSKQEYNRHSRRTTKQDLRMMLTTGQNDTRKRYSTSPVDQLNLPENILSSPFARLNNQQIQVLAIALQERFGI